MNGSRHAGENMSTIWRIYFAVMTSLPDPLFGRTFITFDSLKGILLRLHLLLSYFHIPLSMPCDDLVWFNNPSAKLAKYLPMDQIATVQLKQLISEECSQVWRSAGDTTNLHISESFQGNKSIHSDHVQKFWGNDVFLSHSSKQKVLVRQLHRELTDKGVPCFFDEDCESLSVGEDLPPHIFEAAEKCRIAVLLLSVEFLSTRRPMLELSTLVKARDKNPYLKILPLFFMIQPEDLKEIMADNKMWKALEKCKERRAEWYQALNEISVINGLRFSEGDDEVDFRHEIVKEIWHILRKPSQRNHVPCMQGEERMCHEVADFFSNVQPNEKEIRIVGLYGIAGQGKTTLGKAFCNFKWADFEGNVCHLEFSRGDAGDSFERIKLALHYLTQCPQVHLQKMTKDQAQVELYKRLKGHRVLLVLDNITEECMDEVRNYVQADMGKNSWILLSAQSIYVAVKHFKIDSQSFMRVPNLKEEEAIGILLERTFAGGTTLGAEDKAIALKCANRCSFKEISCDIVRSGRIFHPLALKAFGSHLFSKYGLNLSKWVAETDDLVDRFNYGLDDVFAVLGKAFDDMPPKYRTVFMLLTVYMLPKMSPHKVFEWLAIICNEEISYIEKAGEYLLKKAFIEEIEPEIRIHGLYVEFARSKAKEMGRWLWWKGDQRSSRGLISQDNLGFEMVKLEQCIHRNPSHISHRYLQNLLVLQLVGMRNVRKLDLGWMDSLRSITLHDCEALTVLDGIENLQYLGWLQIIGVNPVLEFPQLSNHTGIQHLEIDIAGSQVVNQLGDLTGCVFLREINVHCPSLLEFPRLSGLPHLERVEFRECDKVKGPLDCVECVELQSIVLDSCRQMAASPILVGCKKLSKIVLLKCDAVMACPNIDVPSVLKTLELFVSSKAALVPKSLEFCDGLEMLQLWNMGELKELPSFRRLSNLTMLKLGMCGIREPPDLTCCAMLEGVYFFTLKNLERFPNFSFLRKLKKLSLYNCRRVQGPPDIGGCHKLQVFHLLYNDNMKGLPKMDGCPLLEEIKMSWHCEDEVTYDGFDPDSCEVDDDLSFCLEHFTEEIVLNSCDVSVPEALKEWQWWKGKMMLLKRYFRGVKLYYSVKAPHGLTEPQFLGQARPVFITLEIVDGMVVPSPTHRMINSSWTEIEHSYFAGKEDNKDLDWFKKVQEYFAGKNDIVRLFADSDVSKSRDKIVLSRLHQLHSQRYHVPAIQGGARMCQEVADFFNTVHPNRKGIRIAGLYGMLGQGKTTLGKAFCNLNLWNFDGKVCHLEFCGGNKLDRQKLALQYLTHCSKLQLESLTREDEAHKKLYERVRGQRVLLVLDNITEESIDEVKYYLGANFGENSCVLLCARNEDILVKNFNINLKARMSVPCLEEEEAIAILLERTSLEVSALWAENRCFVLQCASRCSFKETSPDIVGAAHTFHPLALKTFGRHLFSKYGPDFSKWVDEADGLAFGSGDGLDDVFFVLGKAFDYMDPKYRTIFILLTIYMLPIMSPLKVTEWLAIACKEEIDYIEKAVEDLRQKAFIDEIEPGIRIHDLYVEFAQSKAGKMERWLWCKRDLVTSEAAVGLVTKHEAVVELENLEYCEHLDLSRIGDKYFENLWALQVVDGTKQTNNLRFSLMKHLRSVTLHNCEYLEVIRGMENLPSLALLQVGTVPDFKVLNFGSLHSLQLLEIDIGYSGELTELGDLTGCYSLREIYVCCRSLSEFPGINGLPYLEKANFKQCDEVIGPLNCSKCVKLRSIVFENCSQMVYFPLIVDCFNLSKIVVDRCDAVTEYSDKDEPSALEILELCISSEDALAPRHSECCDELNNLSLWTIVIWRDVPNLRRFSNLSVLKLYKCDISIPPDVTCCSMLEDVYFFTLKYLKSFPNFCSLKKLKKLCLCNCERVVEPPYIGDCHGLQVFHLLYNDSLEELPKMDGCPLLEEIKLSWHSSGDAVDPRHDGLESRWKEDRESLSDDSHSSVDVDLKFCPNYQKDETFQKLNEVFMPVELKEWQWIQGKTGRVKKYFRGGKVYYSITAPYASYDGSGAPEQYSSADALERVSG